MKLFGLLGFPLEHSFSRAYFTEKFRAENVNAEFQNFELEDIPRMIELVHATPNLQGFAVTIPHKEKIIPYLHHVSDEAKAIGAVNSVKIQHTPSGPILSGYNTDVMGFKESLLHFIPAPPEQALLLGTGGASKAVRHVLTSLGIHVATASRAPNTPDQIAYDQIPRIISTHHLIVNATPVGTWPRVTDYPRLPYHLITPEHRLFDLVYNPAITEFMIRGQLQGARACNGLEMLQLQADYSWKIWNS